MVHKPRGSPGGPPSLRQLQSGRRRHRRRSRQPVGDSAEDRLRRQRGDGLSRMQLKY